VRARWNGRQGPPPSELARAPSAALRSSAPQGKARSAAPACGYREACSQGRIMRQCQQSLGGSGLRPARVAPPGHTPRILERRECGRRMTISRGRGDLGSTMPAGEAVAHPPRGIRATGRSPAVDPHQQCGRSRRAARATASPTRATRGRKCSQSQPNPRDRGFKRRLGGSAFLLSALSPGKNSSGSAAAPFCRSALTPPACHHQRRGRAGGDLPHRAGYRRAARNHDA